VLRHVGDPAGGSEQLLACLESLPPRALVFVSVLDSGNGPAYCPPAGAVH